MTGRHLAADDRPREPVSCRSVQLRGSGTRAQRSLAAITEWTQRTGMSELVGLFGGDLGRINATIPLLDQVVALETFASYCWDLRRGYPDAVVQLLAHGNGPHTLPPLADPEAWSEPAAAALRALYLNGHVDDGSRTRWEVPDELRDAVSRWPERVDHGWRERTHATMLPFSTYGRRRIEASVSDLGMAGVRTSHLRDYDHVVVLGGAGLSPLLRCAYAADVIAANSLAPQAIWLLGSPRPVTTTERQRSDTYAPGASDEFDLMSAAGQRVFSRQTGRHEAVCGCADLATACPQWQNRWGHLEASVRADTDVRLQHRRRASLTGGGVEVHVLSASTSQPPRRPNTGDTYELLAELAHLDDNSRVLVVTGQQFVPFQTFDAIRLLHVPHGCHVDAVGHDAAHTDRVHDVGHTLQEVLSALRSARRLGEAVSR